jgi:hypothetical protein
MKCTVLRNSSALFVVARESHSKGRDNILLRILKSMEISVEELVALSGETWIRTEYVFLERADHPSTENGDGIPRGILRLTNRRLFFLNTGVGKDIGLPSAKQSLPICASIIAAGRNEILEILDKTQDTSTDGILRWNDKKFKEQSPIYQYLENEYSFVIPIKRIVTCEQFGPLFWLDQTKGFSKRYARFGIGNDEGLKINYCIYCNNPREPEKFGSVIAWRKWFKEIKRLL